MTFKKNPSSLSRTLAMSALYLSGFPLLLTTGCQTSQIPTLRNPQGVNPIVRSIGKTQLNLDANTPRLANDSAEKLGDNAKKVPSYVLYTISRVPALIGIDPLNNRLFGKGKPENGIFSDPDSSFFIAQRFYNPKSEKPVQAALFNTLDCPVQILRGFGGTLGHTTNSLAQLLNILVILPLSLNTSARNELLNSPEKGYDAYWDSLKLFLDGTTDPAKGLLRSGIYLITSDSTIPPSLMFGYGKLGESFGCDNYNTNGRDQLAELERQLLQSPDCDKCNSVRIGFNSVPFASPVFDKMWNTTFVERDGKLVNVPTYMGDSIRCGIENLPAYDPKMSDIEKAGLGTYFYGKRNGKNQLRLNPNQTTPFAVGTAVKGAAGFLNSGSGGSSGGNFGGGGGGRTPLGK